MDESRKQFSDAFEELTGWELEDYPNQDYADTCWEFWKKSRAAIEIEVPEIEKWRSVDAVRAQTAYKSSITSELSAAGIKVKE
ncbi:hypothetical protein FKK45_21535 [Enterobacter hormaechei]|uniref:hypothetical protein n=1 Tax=Enterobacter hormaechei TaxID=158836 RepID=UPI00190D3B65|nr:hypothetical protein [Enterobacter hormaechei]MBK2957198.1 hypothetical protein [Enterobacter hormaechei]